jgi:glycine C-acetyltransferase/8-amino-7-oxononanoate synthase
MVDEAHATGAIGPGGAGAVAEAGLSGEVDLVVGTLGKALGSYGAYVCASAKVIDLLINTARPFIFSTAPPPPVLGAALAALTLLDRQPGLVEQVRRNGAILRESLAGQGLDVGASRTQIVPVHVGEARRAMALCERSLEGRVFAQAIRPPTVPNGSSRLRLSVMATHRADELCAAAGVIAIAARELGIAPERRPSVVPLRRAA